ncbi:MAG: arginine--tRNA ligase [Betaproteobacteria bacterium]
MSSAPVPDLRAHLSALIAQALRALDDEGGDANIVLDKPRQAQHGDYACNIALQLAKRWRAKPREVAARLVSALPQSPHVDRAEVAGPGFVNIFLTREFKQQVAQRVLRAGSRYGECALGQGKKIQVEFVSANPTGPLHVGHGRGAAFGASLASILSAAGFAVSREYYINDAGRQMDILALSTWLRYLQRAGIAVAFPPNAYQGQYVRDMAEALFERQGSRYVRDAEQLRSEVPDLASDAEGHLDGLIANAKSLLGADYDYLHRYALNEQLADCRSDLAEFGVHYDHWFSERSLYDSGLVARAIQMIESQGHVYEQDGARWFRSTQFGDEKDRVLQRENGQYTYFASDIAYHLNKFERGFDVVVDVWGADHHGYIARVKGAVQALGYSPTRLSIALVQFAVLYRGGQKVSMSTRTAEFVTLRELRREVGNDAARFFYVMRKSDQHLDFDLDLAKSQSNDNPVYYVQYAHARVCSVQEQWGGRIEDLIDVSLAPLTSQQELGLLQKLMGYADTVEDAARDMAPHLIAFYLRELAADFHSYYNATRVLIDDEPLRLARLALVSAVRQVIRNGLELLGVGAPERM